jgi:hypothetical protein
MTTVTSTDPFDTTVFSAIWNKNDSFTLSQERFLGYFIADPSQDMLGQVLEVRTLTCKPRIASYNLSISHVKGVQHSSYTLKDVQPFHLEDNGCFFVSNPPSYIPASCNTDATTGDMVAVQNISLAQLKSTLESWNVFAPLDAMLQNMQYNFSVSSLYVGSPVGDFTLENGTTVPLKEIQEIPSQDSKLSSQTLCLPT